MILVVDGHAGTRDLLVHALSGPAAWSCPPRMVSRPSTSLLVGGAAGVQAVTVTGDCLCGVWRRGYAGYSEHSLLAFQRPATSRRPGPRFSTHGQPWGYRRHVHSGSEGGPWTMSSSGLAWSNPPVVVNCEGHRCLF